MLSFIQRGLMGLGLMVVIIAVVDQGTSGIIGITLLMLIAALMWGIVMWLARIFETVYRKFRA